MTPDAPLIRPAATEDVAALMRIWRGAVESSHDFLGPDDVDGYEPFVAEGLRDPVHTLVAIDEGGRPVGFLTREGAEIHMLFVAPGAQRRGVGTALLDAVADAHPVLRLDVNEQNPSARRFYASRGFVVVGRSDLDGHARPFPLLHLERRTEGSADVP